MHTLQKAVQGTLSVMLWAPTAVLGTAGRMLHLTSAPAATSTKSRAMSLSDALKGVTDNVVDTVVQYVPVSHTHQPPSPQGLGNILTSWGPRNRETWCPGLRPSPTSLLPVRMGVPVAWPSPLSSHLQDLGSPGQSLPPRGVAGLLAASGAPLGQTRTRQCVGCAWPTIRPQDGSGKPLASH